MHKHSTIADGGETSHSCTEPPEARPLKTSQAEDVEAFCSERECLWISSKFYAMFCYELMEREAADYFSMDVDST